MLYICNICNSVHISDKKAHKCARKCIEKLEGKILKSGKDFYCPICEQEHKYKCNAKTCMETCYFLKYYIIPFEKIDIDDGAFPLCALCVHSDENKKTYLPCPQHVFCDEMKSKCVNFEPDVRTFGTKLATDFRLYHLGAES